MDQQMFVPISTICNFKMMKSLTEDAELIKSVMKETKSVVLNPEGTHVRPNFTNQRNTIILREIPSTTPVEDVKSLFARNAGLVQPHTVRSDIGDHWFVQFDKDADCSAAFTFLRSQTFLDKPIQARIKSENLLRGLISSPADIGSLPFQSRWRVHPKLALRMNCRLTGLTRDRVCASGVRYNPASAAVPSGGYFGMGYMNRPGRVRKPPQSNAH
jgi:la-related protein 4